MEISKKGFMSKLNKYKFFMASSTFIKFIYSEKATKLCEISTLLLSYVVPDKSKVKISQNFVVFSEYMNFTYMDWRSKGGGVRVSKNLLD